MKRRIAVYDFETDPFEYNRVPAPFTAGYYDGDRYISWWGDDCPTRFVDFLHQESDPLCVYAHNGGKFDIWFLLPSINTGSIKIVNGRILQASVGPHELRDSFALMPFALEKYQKTKIDYTKFERCRRERNRDEISSYLRDDCVYLYELVSAFVSEFGDKLTIGSASLKQLKTFHSFKCGGPDYDARFRKDFYFGGRNQVFESGILKGNWKVYDVNSMYPHVMRDYLHPVGTAIDIDNRITPKTCFVVTEGYNRGAFPVRTKTGGLDFTTKYGTYSTTIHEFNAAVECGYFTPKRILKTYGFAERESFDTFVDHFYELRQTAIRTDDQMHKLFYKYVLNSAYGKFAQNPENYYDWFLASGQERPHEWHDCDDSCPIDCPKAWTPKYECYDKYVIWQRPTQMHHFYNVATGASITGAARAVLLRGIHAARRPIYCDTDSVICESMEGVAISPEILGAWKLESTATLAAICGKKLYALFEAQAGKPTEETCVKKAHKGARLKAMEIYRIARGAVVEAPNPVPAFGFDGTARFTTRKIRKTA